MRSRKGKFVLNFNPLSFFRYSSNTEDYETFEDTFLSTLNKYVPLKKKVLRANHKPYVTKAMRKAIMKRSELVTKYRKNPTDENLKAWKKQKNYCSN